jgi:hypothetical protein
MAATIPRKKVIAENIKFRPHADVMCEALNDKFAGSRFYRVVEDDYVPQPGFEP